MESLKKLKDAADECLRDWKAIESKISVSDGNLAFLNSKKGSLTAEIADLETKKTSIMDTVGALEREAQKRIDAKLQEIKTKEDQMAVERADLKTKQFQADSAKTDSDQARDKYSALYAEFQTKLQELADKKQAVMDALK